MGCGSCSSGGCSPTGCGDKGHCASGGCNRLNVHDWLSNLELPWGQKAYEYVEVRFKSNRKDFSTQQALIKLVGKRRDLLTYLQKNDIMRYRAILEKLNLRK
jgi:hypothetical protein